MQVKCNSSTNVFGLLGFVVNVKHIVSNYTFTDQNPPIISVFTTFVTSLLSIVMQCLSGFDMYLYSIEMNLSLRN